MGFVFRVVDAITRAHFPKMENGARVSFPILKLVSYTRLFPEKH